MVPLEYFLRCTIKRGLNNTTLNISQPHLIAKITQGFNNDVQFITPLNTLDTPHKGIVRKQEMGTKISKDIQKRYQSCIGSLLYLVKLSHPESSKSVCEMSKCTDEANMIHCKALICAIKCSIAIENNCYHMK